MTAGILIACYVTGLIVAGRIYVRFSDEETGEARFNGTIVGLIWPVALVIVTVIGLLSLPTLGAKTKLERQAEARRRLETAEWERDKLKTRIAELEREAGMR